MFTHIEDDVVVKSVRYRKPPRSLSSGIVYEPDDVAEMSAYIAPSTVSNEFELSDAWPVQFLASENARPMDPEPCAVYFTVTIPATSLPKSNMSVEPFPHRATGLVSGKDEILWKVVEYTVVGETMREAGE